jgi:putative CRISPR-associated protein (TIGR02619 family)
MKKNLIISTVGTSLLQEKKGNRKEIKEKTFPPIDISQDLDLKSLNQSTIEEKLSENNHSFNKVFKALKRLTPNDELAKRGGPYDPKINPDLLPAELSSLYLFYWPDGNIPNDGQEADNKDIIILLPSETKPSIFCACCLKKYLEEKEPLKSKILRVEIKEIESLQTKDTKKFEETALLNLSTILRKEIEHGHKHNCNVVLNITGGYKAIPPYVTVIGNCFPKVDIIYLYEHSKDLIHLPLVPINFDLMTYRDYRAIIKVLTQPRFTAGESLYNVLPSNIKACFLKKRPEMKLNFFGETMIEKYKTEKINLTPYGKGLLLLDKINNPELRRYLTGCINQWQHLWIGDKIPEMVEHARGHTQRVLEIAAELLYPILEENGNFLNDIELSSLIGAIWLHDLGNSGEMFNFDSREYILSGFPSLIRDFHNVITYTILEEEKDEIFPEEVEIKKDKYAYRNALDTLENIIANIKIISKYHRKWTPLTQNQMDDEHKMHHIKLEEAVVAKGKLQFLTALYRVLDACDTQLERTVDDAYIDTRKNVVNRELRILRKEKVDLEGNSEIQNFIDKFDKNQFKCCDDVDFNSLKGDLKWISTDGKETEEKIKDEIDKYANCINQVVGDIKTSSNANVSETVERWLSCLDQIFFKKRQPFHYEKHRGISAVMILPEGVGGAKFNIRMIGAEGTREDDLKAVLKKDICSEYEVVKDVLDPFLKFEFSYQCYGDVPKLYRCMMEEEKDDKKQ